MNSPIADLTYRTYDGPLEKPYNRWWAITRMHVGQTIKKKAFWIWTAVSSWYFLAMGFILFLISQVQQLSKGTPANHRQNEFLELLGRVVWKDQFLIAFSFGQVLYLILAMLVGSGTISNDNRANALLVYLSKPCTKLDYIVGKWLAVFIAISRQCNRVWYKACSSRLEAR